MQIWELHNRKAGRFLPGNMDFVKQAVLIQRKLINQQANLAHQQQRHVIAHAYMFARRHLLLLN